MIGKIKQVGNDIMFHAITHANVNDVIALLADNEVNVNGTNINGQTPLHVSYSTQLTVNIQYAVKAENRTIIEILLQYGADPNKQENFEVGKSSPMHLAAERNMIQMIDQFIGCGGDVTI